MNLNRMPSPKGGSPEGQRPMTPSEIQEIFGKMQSKVALREYQKECPDLQIDTENPDNNPKEIRKAAMLHLIESGMAAKIRAAADTEFGEGSLGTDPEALRQVLEKLGVTLH